MGILDQDVDDRVSLAVPQLYRRGIERLEWTQVKFWTYMVDGLYQSLIIFYFTYLVFSPATTNTDDGRNVNDYKRFGVYILNPAVVVVNLYVLLNTYRWDWFILLITSISILLVFFWTGVYTSFTAGFTFYGAGAQVYGTLSFWATALLAITLCLLPRFAAKAFQKIYRPRDVDVVREQIRQGKFDYLQYADPASIMPGPNGMMGGEMAESTSSSDSSKRSHKKHAKKGSRGEDDQRPIYPPSIAATATTHGPRSNNGSDGTEYTGHRSSLDRAFPPVYTNINAAARPQPGDMANMTPTITTQDMDAPTPTQSYHTSRPSFDRLRSSMDRTRPSFEASRDFTSAAYLARVESSQSATRGDGHGGTSSRTQDISGELSH